MKNRNNPAGFDLKGMKATIEEIERLVLDLKTSGAGIPVIEKNVRIILSFVNVLKLGVVDPAELPER